ncbi:phosphatidylserine decarboxylase [Kwoniella dejecticola CBS 10117]|uniref:Phosphatidylserine decarboxylase proenzyme 2 n=1 Tax=Kwoniella dejecticola CBS 10117 TaxID=1296121 RepID=A0A1A6ABL7_9TREE|nr:phosphatidylserine decarboxylase [Kwoniella dejecticola CBS 10117]OBR87461.1 phosphatidylserine decarboxylase [Kwoniella dejecticola CBS 10117]
MSPNTDAALAHSNPNNPNDNSLDTPSRPPRLKRLASKPLKMAASTFRSSRAPSPGPSDTTNTLISSDSGLPDTARSGRFGRRKSRHAKIPAGVGMTPAQIASAAQGPRKPLEGEEPAAYLRVRVVSAKGLVAKDRGGTSDPFLTLLMPPSSRFSTKVIKKSLDPTFPAETSTFDFPIYLSMTGVIGGRGIECVLWDKDLMRKEYMGELTIPVEKWFNEGDIHLWHENIPLSTQKLLSTRRKHTVTGSVSFQIGFVPPKEASDPEDALKRVRRVYGSLVEQASVGRHANGVLGVPAHKGIGTVKMRQEPIRPSTLAKPTSVVASAMSGIVSSMRGGHKTVPVAGQPVPDDVEDDDEGEDEEDLLSDDGMSSSSSDDEFEDALEEEESETPMGLSESPSVVESAVAGVSEQTAGLPDSKAKRDSSGLLAPAPIVPGPKSPSKTGSQGDYFTPSMGKATSSDSTVGTPGAMTPGGTKTRRPLFKRGKSRTGSSTQSQSQSQTVEKKRSKRGGFNFDASQGKEVLGIVILEIKGAEDLPKLKNALKFSFDMDPFVVISFGKKVFRTRVIRHSLNPTWDEKLLFHVRRHESSYTMQFAVLDWDKVSGNDMVGTCTLPLSELIADAPKPDPETGLYDKNVDGKHEMKEFTLNLNTEKDVSWEARHSPKLTVRAKYEPYDALRQRFWRQYITQYDADDSGCMSYTELTAMLDSLGSTLTRRTIEGYFEICGKSAEKDELTMEEVIHCLENEVTKSRSEKEKVSTDDLTSANGLGGATPAISARPAQEGLDTTGPQGNIHPSAGVDPDELAEHIERSRPKNQEGAAKDGEDVAGNVQPISASDRDVPAVKVERTASVDGTTIPSNQNKRDTYDDGGDTTPGSITYSETEELDNDPESPPEDDRERVINIKTCPLCHRPRLGKKSEQDIVTHLAVCASADWSRVDRIVTANYVTSSQAQRKFLSKIVNKVAIGSYALGANSANILVQDRRTGQLQEEKMAVYVRLGIRVLYKGAKGQMHSVRARKLLKSLSVKQGLKYDSPSSAIDIPGFIAFHNLDTNEILDPLDSFKNFNEFFYRKLKPDARPVDEPSNEGRLVSCADCRMMAFETVNEATSIWIKGREFTVARLLGPNYKDVAARYEGGGLAIFRLAPQDYHRFHSPVKGVVGKMTLIDGEYYTVNPQAIRTTLDVYGENVRKVVPIQSEEFGLVMTVWIGAMMVGSILTTVEEGQEVDRADELGYFAFGGSTIVCLFEKGSMKFDEDLLQNGRASIETLVRMGSGIGRSTKKSNNASGVVSGMTTPASASAIEKA